jgi:hypothetical protein
LALATLTAGLGGCGTRDAASIAEPGLAGNARGVDAVGLGRPFYPLAVGDQWGYELHTRVHVRSGDVPQPALPVGYSVSAGITARFGTGPRAIYEYSQFGPGGTDLDRFQTELYQDRTGLYWNPLRGGPTLREPGTAEGTAEAEEDAALRAYVDRVVARPEQRPAFRRTLQQIVSLHAAARGASGGIHTPPSRDLYRNAFALLQYPLRPGARWNMIPNDPSERRTVVGIARVTVPAGTFTAWQVARDSDLFGPLDRVSTWYGTVGLVREVSHFERDVHDDSGAVIGHIVEDWDQALSFLRLVDPPGPMAVSPTP